MKNSISWHKRQMEKHRDDALKVAEKQLISMALTVMRNHKNCTSFMIAMGTWCFFTTDSWGQLADNNPKSYTKSIIKFIQKWDEDLYLTGNSLYIYPDGKILRDW